MFPTLLLYVDEWSLSIELSSPFLFAIYALYVCLCTFISFHIFSILSIKYIACAPLFK